ncbi:MAG: DUF2391 family protein [Halobacteriales archaeon]
MNNTSLDSTADTVAPPVDRQSDETAVEDLIRQLEELGDTIESSSARDEIQETKELLAAASDRGLIDTGVRRLDVNDAAEAFVGSVIFASPLLVEDGVFDIANHLFQRTLVGIPLFLIANTVFVVVMTYALLEWTGRDKAEHHLLFGRIPTRVVMILVVSFVVATILMTVWGRVGDWQPPTEAVARVNVLWTVGSIGAALGDILSADDADDHAPDLADLRPNERSADIIPTGADESISDGEFLRNLNEQLADLEARVDNDSARSEVQQLRARTQEAISDEQFGDNIRKYTSRDIAEAFVGSIFFSIPFLIEDGVFDVAEYFLSFRIGEFPLFFLLNAGFVLVIVTALVYRTGPQDVQVSRPLFGIIPRRLVGITLVSFLTAAALMTMWGRVNGWQDPTMAVARISVVWTVASFGAALGDILPGESSGDDINDDIADIGEMLKDGDDSWGG